MGDTPPGGAYIMHAFATDGSAPNNRLFSPESIEMMDAVIATRGQGSRKSLFTLQRAVLLWVTYVVVVGCCCLLLLFIQRLFCCDLYCGCCYCFLLFTFVIYPQRAVLLWLVTYVAVVYCCCLPPQRAVLLWLVTYVVVVVYPPRGLFCCCW